MSQRPSPPTFPPLHTADHEGREQQQFDEARKVSSFDTVSPPNLRTAATFERG